MRYNLSTMTIPVPEALRLVLSEVPLQQLQERWLDEAQLRDEELEGGTVEAVPGPAVFARIPSRRS